MRSSRLTPSSRTAKSSMYPSSFSTRAMAAFKFEAGICTSIWPTTCALRMRVSMSAIGSLMLIRFSLPTGLDHAGHFAPERELAQLAAREAEFAEYAARPAGERAAVAQAHGRGVARQLLQSQARFVAGLVGGARTAQRLEQRGTPGLELGHGLAAELFAQLHGELGHLGLLSA